MSDERWTDVPVMFMCPGGAITYECDRCGGTTFEQRGNCQRKAIRCKGCGDVEIESLNDLLGISDHDSAAP